MLVSDDHKCACLCLGMESLLRDEDNEVPECKVSRVEYSKASLRTTIYSLWFPSNHI